MNTQSLSTPEVFQWFSRKCKSLFLQSCPREFMMFLCEYLVNLLTGNLRSVKFIMWQNFRTKLECFYLEKINLETKLRASGIQKRFTPHKRSYSSLLKPSFLLILASVYNKHLNTQSVTKQEIPKYQALPNPTYQIDSLKLVIKKAKADSLEDNVLSCPRVKLANSQT